MKLAHALAAISIAGFFMTAAHDTRQIIRNYIFSEDNVLVHHVASTTTNSNVTAWSEIVDGSSPIHNLVAKPPMIPKVPLAPLLSQFNFSQSFVDDFSNIIAKDARSDKEASHSQNDHVRTLESYGGVPGLKASPAEIEANLAALSKWQAEVSANISNPPALSFNGKMFGVGSNKIVFSAHNINLKGGSATRSSDSRNGGLYSTKDSGIAFSFEGYAPLLEGVHLQGLGRTSGLAVTASFIGLPAGDLDARLIETRISGAATALMTRGRGFEMVGGTLYDAAVGADIGMPDLLSEPKNFTNTREGGSRVFRFLAVRFHSITANDIQNIDINTGPFLSGIQIIACYSDTLATFFRGHLNYGLISNNMQMYSNNYGVNLLSSKNSIISNNTFGGGPMSPKEFKMRYPSLSIGPQDLKNAIRLDGPTTNLDISGNMISFTSEAPFYFLGPSTHKNILIRNNTSYVSTFSNNEKMYSFVKIDPSAVMDGFTFSGNRGYYDDPSSVNSVDWLLNKGVIKNLIFFDNYNNINSPSRAVNNMTGSYSYIRDYSPRDSLTSLEFEKDLTLTTGVDGEIVRYSADLTGTRRITLNTTNGYPGAKFKITRTGGGQFGLNVGDGPLKILGKDQWCEVVFDGTKWYLSSFGSLR